MRQVSRIGISALLITSVSCGKLSEQAQRTTVPQALHSQTTLPSLSIATTSLSPWVVDDHGETAGALEADTELIDENAPSKEGTTAAPDANTDPTERRALKLFSLNERTLLEVTVSADGRVDDADRAQLEYFFRCRRTEQTHAMAEGVLKILYAISQKYPGRVIEIVSGYRTFPFGVRDSKHYEGYAIDLRVRGIRTSRVRDFVWMHFSDVGVGHYEHQNFVHVDYRPEDKDTAWTSATPNDRYAYNPHWALRLRAPWRAPRAL